MLHQDKIWLVICFLIIGLAWAWVSRKRSSEVDRPPVVEGKTNQPVSPKTPSDATPPSKPQPPKSPSTQAEEKPRPKLGNSATKGTTQRDSRETELSRQEEVERRREARAEEDARKKEEAGKGLQVAIDRMKVEEKERRAREEREATQGQVKLEFARYIAQPVPPDIQRSMRAFLSGQFIGADRSPLAYVGYRVGKTNGLPARERERRMLVCFRVDIPSQIKNEYGSWGGPGSLERLNGMYRHLKMLAAQRRGRPGFEVAVSEWERDAAWLKSELRALAEKFSKYGVTY